MGWSGVRRVRRRGVVSPDRGAVGGVAAGGAGGAGPGRLDVGAHTEAVPELEQLVVEHPFRERFRGQLMVALHRCGRQAEALRVVPRVTVGSLAEETGLEPSRELVELERRIALERPVAARS